MNKKIYNIIFLSVLLVPWLFSNQALAQGPEMSPQFIQVAKKRISRSVYEFTFKTTLINHDTDIKNVSATVTSTSQNTVIMADNALSFNNVTANESTTSLDTFVLRQDRRFLFNPDDLQWNINYEPSSGGQDIEIDGAIDIQRSVRMQLDDTVELYNAYKFYAKNKENFSIVVEHKFEPEQGLALTTLTNDGLSSTTGFIEKFISQYLTATQAGQYSITTTATLLETGEKFTAITEVLVTEGELPPDIRSLKSWPPALSENTLTDVFFSITVAGDFTSVTDVKLKNLQDNSIIILKDSSGSYTETVEVNSENMASGDCLSYQAVFDTTQGIFNSNVYKLCVTRFPLRLQRTVERTLVTDSETGIQASADEVLIIVKKGISEADVEAIAASVNGHVIHVIPQIQSYQIQLDTAVTTMDELYVIVEQLSALPKVEHAAPNALLKLNSLETDDSLLSVQSHLTAVRAREAWFVNRGSEEHIVAIVDSGIDIDHPDLKNKIIGGDNFAWPFDLFTDDYSDNMGHGTHVAGTVAAETDNGMGVAGISWENPLLIAKV